MVIGMERIRLTRRNVHLELLSVARDHMIILSPSSFWQRTHDRLVQNPLNINGWFDATALFGDISVSVNESK